MANKLIIEVDGKQRELTIPEGSVEAVFNVNDFSIASTAVYTYDISIPYEKNAKALGFVIDANSKDGKRIKCSKIKAIYQNGAFCIKGTWHVDGFITEGETTKPSYNVLSQFTNNINDFLDDDCKLRDLDLVEFLFSKSNVENTWNDNPYDGTTPLYFPLTNNGGLEGKTHVPIECFEPHIYDKAIIEAIEKKLNINIKSSFFETEYFKRHILTFGSECEFVQSFYSATLISPIQITGFQDINIGGLLPDLQSDYNIDGEVVIGAGSNVVFQQTDEYTFKVTALVSNVGSNETGTAAIFFIKNLGGAIGYGDLQNGLNEFEFTARLQDLDFITLLATGVYNLDDMTISVCRKEILKEDSYIQIGESLPCKTAREYLQDLAVESNLMSIYDEKNKCLIIEPMFDAILPTGESVKGFHRFVDSEDWTGKIVRSEVNGDYNPFDYQKTLQMGHCEDEDDESTLESLYLCEYNLCDRFVKGETDKKMKCIGIIGNNLSPQSIVDVPPIQQGQGVQLSIPTQLTDDPTEKFCSDKMKRLYKVGQKQGIWGWYENEVQSEYPFATALSEVDNVNMGFCDSNDTKGRVTLFYDKFLEAVNEGQILALDIQINKSDVLDIVSLFRKPKFFNLKVEGVGNYVLRRIEGYTFEQKDVVRAYFLGLF